MKLKPLGDFLKKNYGSIVTLAIVLMALYGYFSIYIPHNEQLITARKYRALQQLNKNINQQFVGFHNFFTNSDEDFVHRFGAYMNLPNSYRNLCYVKDSFSEGPCPVKITYEGYVDSMRSLINKRNRNTKLLKLDVIQVEYNEYPDIFRKLDPFDSTKAPVGIDTLNAFINSGNFISNANDTTREIAKVIAYYYKEDSVSRAAPPLGGGRRTTKDKIRSYRNDKLSIVIAKSEFGQFMTTQVRSEFNYYLLIHNDKKGVPQITYSNEPNLGLSPTDIRMITNTADDNQANKPSAKSLNTDSILSYAFRSTKSIVIGGVEYKAFVFPVMYSGNYPYTICGLVPLDEFNKEKKTISAGAAFYLMVVILLFIFSVPFLKLLLLNEYERLTRADLLYAMISILAASVIIIGSIALQNQKAYYAQEITERYLHQINDNVSNKLKYSVTDACQKLCVADYLRRNGVIAVEDGEFYSPRGTITGLMGNAADLSKGLTIYYSRSQAATNHKANHSMPVKNYFLFSDIVDSSIVHYFWNNIHGDQLYSWTQDASDTSGNNSFERAYFQNIVGKKGRYLFTFDQPWGKDKTFTVQTVLSWISGALRTVISMNVPEKDYKTNPTVPAIAAVTLNPDSYNNTLLPMGYGYSVINADGDVYFSSDRNTIVNENFKQECEDSVPIIACMHNRTMQTFTTQYHGQDCTFCIQPVGTLPLFIISFSNNEYHEAIINHAILYTTAMVVFIFLFLVLQFVLIQFAETGRYKTGLFVFQLNWLWPVDDKRIRYFKVTAFNLLVIVLMGVMFHFININVNTSGNSIYILYVALFSILASSGLLYFSFMRKEPPEKELNTSFNPALVPLYMAILLTVCALFTDQRFKLLGYELVLAVFAFIFSEWGQISKTHIPKLRALLLQWNFIKNPIVNVESPSEEPRLNKLGKLLSKWEEGSMSYLKPEKLNKYWLLSAVFFSWIFLCCALPSEFFLRTGYNHQAAQYIKDVEMHLASDYPSKSHYAFSPNHKGIDSLGRINFRKTFNDSNWTNASRKKDILYHTMVDDIRYLYNPVLVHSRYITEVADTLKDTEPFLWSEVGERVNLKYTYAPGKQVYIMAKPYTFAFFPHNITSKVWWELLLYLILLITGGLFFIKYFLGKFFMFNFLPNGNKKEDIQAVLLYGTKEQSGDKDESLKGSMVFINGIPGSGKYSLVKNTLPENSFYELSFMKMPDNVDIDKEINAGEIIEWLGLNNVEEDKIPFSLAKTVVIRDFEYNFNNWASNRVKLNTIEMLMVKGKRIIFISDIQPISILDSYAQFDEAAKPEEIKQAKADKMRWAKLLGDCIFLSHHPQDNWEECTIKKFGVEDTDLPPALVIANECQRGTFLKKLGEEFLEPDTNNRATKYIRLPGSIDEALEEIQSRASLYYQNVWHTLTKPEQNVIYNLAEEGLLNQHSREAIKSLHSKGLLTSRGGKLLLWNESFRNFILAEIKKDEVSGIEKQTKENGRWNNFRVPILIIIIALIVVLISAQPKAFGSIFAYVSAFAAGMNLVQRVLSAFNFKSGG